MQYFLEFEKPLVELEQKIRELRDYSTTAVDSPAISKNLRKRPRNCATRSSRT